METQLDRDTVIRITVSTTILNCICSYAFVVYALEDHCEEAVTSFKDGVTQGLSYYLTFGIQTKKLNESSTLPSVF